MNNINLKLGMRTLYRDRKYAILNILGLSIGMASAMLIFLWVQFQVSFDRFHTNTDNLYRVIQDQFYTEGEVFHVNVTPPGMSSLLKENMPGIKYSTRYSREEALIQVGENKIFDKVHFVDTDFFYMFSFPLLKGDPKTALINSHSIVITEKMSEKLFGKKNPLGQTVLLEAEYPFTVTGVIKNTPENTEITFNFLIPFITYKEFGRDIDALNSNWLTTFVQLSEGTTSKSVDDAIEAYKKEHFKESTTIYFLQPLRRMHLYAIWGGGPIKNVRLFSIIAILLILVAAINFTNLSTAMATKRYREIGVKKSYGASRRSLITQFFTETLILSFISLFIALILTETFLPLFNSLLKTNLHVNYYDWKLISVFLLIMLFTGILSGIYPALFLSSYKPVNTIKASGNSNHRSVMREILVVLQFCLAIVLIVNTIIVKKQQNYMQKRDLGIEKENIIYIRLRGELMSKFELFKSKILQNPDIKKVCFGSHLPAGIWSNGGGYKWQDKPEDIDPLVSNTNVDFDYASVFGIKIIEGKFYSEGKYVDTNNIVINKTFADIIGIKPIIGEEIEAWGKKRKVIGVTEDFNFKPLNTKIEPLILYCWPQNNLFAFIKISSENVKKTINYIGSIHNELNENFPFEYHFLIEDYDKLYESEQRQGRIFNIFSFLAIFISCLGLLGLSSYMMQQRTKEIGIRKANGANDINILTLFSRYYTRWVIVSFIIALPISYYFIHSWLKNYAYRTSISWWIFVLAGLLTYVIALLTVIWQSRKASRKNPVEALRYE